MASYSGGVKLETLAPRWDGPVIIAATGESLTKSVATQITESGFPVIAIKQAGLRLPSSDVLFANNDHTWRMYDGFPQFRGERWSTHSSMSYDCKVEVAREYKIHLIRGQFGNTFSTDPSYINYGNNSGFQAINLAVHWLRKPGRIVLVGFDMTGNYFFGKHPRRNAPEFHAFLPRFEQAAKAVPDGVEIVLGTPSAMTCFPMMTLDRAMEVRC